MEVIGARKAAFRSSAALRRNFHRAKATHQYLSSLTSSRELWACTYAQWVATKAQNAELKLDLERHIRATGLICGEPYSSQWEPDDFKCIMQAVDNLFIERGWL